MTLFSPLTLTALLDRSIREFADLQAIGYAAETYMTYREFGDQVHGCSEVLRSRGVSPGDRVAIIGESSPNWGVAYFAITTMGCVAVPVLPDFHPSEMHHILRHSECSAVFVSERSAMKLDDLDRSPFNAFILIDTLSLIEEKDSTTSLKQLIANGSRELRKIRAVAMQFVGLRSSTVKEDDIAAIIYTSGTTGHSKGVMLTHKNIVWNAQQSADIPPMVRGDRLLSTLPLAHVYECTLGLILPIMTGASISYLRKPPTATVMLPALQAVRPTTMLVVPLIIEKIYKTKILPEIRKKFVGRMLVGIPYFRKKFHGIAGKKLMEMFGGSLKFFGIGGSALAPDVELFLKEARFPYAIGYGMTETSPLIAGSPPRIQRYRTTGLIVPGLEVKIENPDPVSGVGEVIVRGPSVMKGYYKDPVRTAEVLRPDGWLHTGDLGVFDEVRHLALRGRLKNVILGPSGENIYPEAIESIINRAAYVLESLVYQEGGSLVARIFLDYESLDSDAASSGETESMTREHINKILDELKESVNLQVSGFSKLSRVIEQREPFEKTPTLKIKRYLYTS
ncbi:MAG TPA: AMP-binding protein [Bacteroidota bacterium]|nr:AMP-binding protein [Bacteroidota bacterium]